jgi:hypothetical protein
MGDFTRVLLCELSVIWIVLVVVSFKKQTVMRWHQDVADCSRGTVFHQGMVETPPKKREAQPIGCSAQAIGQDLLPGQWALFGGGMHSTMKVTYMQPHD